MALQEKEENKKLKQKQRDRMQPKVGKLDIDYQVLHDAFFKHQTKPHLTRLGEIYYEGKEFEARVRFACCAADASMLRKLSHLDVAAVVLVQRIVALQQVRRM